MALRKVYIGSVGPFIYDDTDLVDDPDGDFVGYTQKSVLTDGPVEGAPVTSKPAQGAIADLAVTDPADSPATADALRDDLVANAIPDIETKVNAILTALRGYGVIAT